MLSAGKCWKCTYKQSPDGSKARAQGAKALEKGFIGFGETRKLGIREKEGDEGGYVGYADVSVRIYVVDLKQGGGTTANGMTGVAIADGPPPIVGEKEEAVGFVVGSIVELSCPEEGFGSFVGIVVVLTIAGQGEEEARPTGTRDSETSLSVEGI